MRRALVVDDAEDIRFLMRSVLSRAGFEVEEALGGAEALSLLAHGGAKPDVIVLDVQMPEMDGWETLAAIRELPAGADVPVVLCTVKTGVADRERAWTLGCDAYLTKPFSIDTLAYEASSVAARQPSERETFRAAQLQALRYSLPTEKQPPI